MSIFIPAPPSLYRTPPQALPVEVWIYRFSPYTITILAFLMALTEGRVMSSRMMAKNLGISRQRVEDSLAELRSLNVVAVEKVPTSPRRLVNRYSVRPVVDWLSPEYKHSSEVTDDLDGPEEFDESSAWV